MPQYQEYIKNSEFCRFASDVWMFLEEDCRHHPEADPSVAIPRTLIERELDSMSFWSGYRAPRTVRQLAEALEYIFNWICQISESGDEEYLVIRGFRIIAIGTGGNTRYAMPPRPSWLTQWCQGCFSVKFSGPSDHDPNSKVATNQVRPPRARKSTVPIEDTVLEFEEK